MFLFTSKKRDKYPSIKEREKIVNFFLLNRNPLSINASGGQKPFKHVHWSLVIDHW